ncbi:hypothetical protein D3C71_1732390 [compost metagenome]
MEWGGKRKAQVPGVGVGVEVAFQRGIDAAFLGVRRRGEARQARQAQFTGDIGQVAQLEIDRTYAPSDPGVQRAFAFGLEPALRRRQALKHGEVGRDDGVEFVSLPVGSYF